MKYVVCHFTRLHAERPGIQQEIFIQEISYIAFAYSDTLITLVRGI